MANLTPNQFRNLTQMEQVELETYVLLCDLKEGDLHDKKIAAEKKAKVKQEQLAKQRKAQQAVRGGQRR